MKHNNEVLDRRTTEDVDHERAHPLKRAKTGERHFTSIEFYEVDDRRRDDLTSALGPVKSKA